MTQEARQYRQPPQFSSIEEELKWHRENNSNILVPTSNFLVNRYYQPVIDHVYLSIEQDDAYPRKDAENKQKYALTMQGLNRIALCAGVSWDPQGIGRADDGTDSLYVAWQATAYLRLGDGSRIYHTATYEVDLEIIREDLEEKYREKAKKQQNKTAEQKEQYVRYCVNRDYEAKRQRRLTLAESGAKTRALRSLLGVKSLYSGQEMAKPFVVVRYMFIPPDEDPTIRRQVTAIGMGVINMEPPARKSTETLPEPESRPDPDNEPANESPDDYGKENNPAGKAPGTTSSDPQPKSQSESRPESTRNTQTPAEQPQFLDEQQWNDATVNEKVIEIKKTANLAGYDLKAFEGRAGCELKDLEIRKLTQLYRNLCSMAQQK